MHHTDEEMNNIIDAILAKLKDHTEQIDKLKLDNDLVLSVCNIIENSVPVGNKHKINKKRLALKVLAQIFGLTDLDKYSISQQIDLLHNDGKIKKVKFLTNAKHFLADFFNH
jgi:seryl-tRNA synthetase